MQKPQCGPLTLFLPLFSVCTGRVCPRGQVFSDCVSSCPPSCSSPQPPGPAAAMGQCREECVGGCECPPGLYLHQGLCLKRDDCPCFHRRRTYQSGDRIQQRCNTWYEQTVCVCSLFPLYFPDTHPHSSLSDSLSFFLLFHSLSVCRAGQWQCTGEKCAAQCSLMGALQVTTFDKKRYSLQGGDCAFTAVEVRYIKCNHAQSHTHTMRGIHVCGYFVLMLCVCVFRILLTGSWW